MGQCIANPSRAKPVARQTHRAHGALLQIVTG